MRKIWAFAAGWAGMVLLTIWAALHTAGAGRSLDSQYGTGRFWIWFGALGSAGTGLLALGVLRDFGRQVRALADDMLRGADEVFTASGQMGAANHSVAQCTSAEAANLQDTSASATEITAIARRLAHRSAQAASEALADGARALQSTGERLRWIFGGGQKPSLAEPARAAPSVLRNREVFPLDDDEVLAGELGDRF